MAGKKNRMKGQKFEDGPVGVMAGWGRHSAEGRR